MRILRLVLLVCVGLFLLYAKFVSLSTNPAQNLSPNSAANSASNTGLISTPAPDQPLSNPPAADGSVPGKVLQVLQVVRSTGQPPDGYVGGRVFENREGRLPASGDYREFDVDPHNGGRNAERIIVEWNTKKAWYTADHYQTFTPLP